jgi:hypothetical protein
VNVNGRKSGGVSRAFPANPYKKCKKSRIQPEKCIAKILVNGFILARVNRKPKLKVVPDGFATSSDLAA